MNDLISRQAAIDNLKRHLNGTDVPDSYPGIFNAIEEWLSDWEVPSVKPNSKESSLTQKALDSISRQDAIDMIYGCEDEFGKDVVFRIADYIRQLPSVKSKQLQVLANVLDGCPLTRPCDKMWRGGWCEEHCKNNKLQEPNAECWLKYAEVMASE